jgi:hypothetical protein
VLDVPRCALLALWGSAALAGDVPDEVAQAAVTGDDDPHRVTGLGVSAGPAPAAADTDGATDLRGAIACARVGGATALRPVLPVAGDVLGLPGPAALNRAAVEAGECVVVEGAIGPLWALVPQVLEYGSSWEPGVLVSWRAHPAEPRRVTDLGSVAEAERELREALMASTEELGRLDVARWSEDAADRVAAVRDGVLPAGVLPPGTPARSVRVLALAARVRAIAALGREDDGAAVSAFEVTRRDGVLRDLERVCRRAVVAAAASYPATSR